MRLDPNYFRHAIGLNKPVGPLRIDRAAPPGLLRKLKFLAVFGEGRGAPRDLVSGRFAVASGGTPGWRFDTRDGPVADLRGTAPYWSWTGFTHGILNGDYTLAARFRLTASASWGGIVGIERASGGDTLYHHTSNNIAWDRVGTSGSTISTPWPSNVFATGAASRIDSAASPCRFYMNGVNVQNSGNAGSGGFAANAEISVGDGQAADNVCRGDVAMAAIFSPALSDAEAKFFTANPYCLVEEEPVPRVWPAAGGAATRSEVASLQAALRRQINLQAALGAAARAARTLSVSSGAALARGQLRSDSIDAAVQALVSAQADLNAALTRSLLAGAGMDANVTQQGLSQRVAALDGAVRRLNALGGSLEAALRAGGQASAQVDSPLARLVQDTIGLDAATRLGFELPALALAAALRATPERVTALDAAIGLIVAAAASRTLNVAAPGRHAVAANRRQVEIPAGKRRH
jgi:hypothetical protein